jgi:hypothetical protein
MLELTIDQAHHRQNPSRMLTPMLAIGLGQGLIVTEAIDGVLDDDTALGKGTIVGDVFGWTLTIW